MRCVNVVAASGAYTSAWRNDLSASAKCFALKHSIPFECHRCTLLDFLPDHFGFCIHWTFSLKVSAVCGGTMLTSPAFLLPP